MLVLTINSISRGYLKNAPGPARETSSVPVIEEKVNDVAVKLS